MGDTTVGKLAKADAVIPGIYSVYIDQDDRPDGFTVRESDLAAYLVPGDRTNFDRTGCREAHPNNNRLFDPCLKVAQGNSFELAGGTPLDKAMFQNTAGEKIEAGAKVVLLPEKAPEYAANLYTKLAPAITFTASALTSGTSLFANKSPWQGSWTVTGFKIAGFTDDPDRKNTENMSSVPDEKRKYAVIHAVISSAEPVDYKEMPSIYIGRGGYDILPIHETRELPLDRLSTKFPPKWIEPEGAIPPGKKREDARPSLHIQIQRWGMDVWTKPANTEDGHEKKYGASFVGPKF